MEPLPFRILKSDVDNALKNGIMFEFALSPAFRGAFSPGLSDRSLFATRVVFVDFSASTLLERQEYCHVGVVISAGF